MILEEIVADKRREIGERKQRISLAEFRRRAESVREALDLRGALVKPNVALIAEIKRASPSRGALKADADIPRLARTYAQNGAAAISVLTDKKHFGGSLNDLKVVRVAADVPILRKDFVVDEYQVYEARALQADALLLIVRLLSSSQLSDYRMLAESLGMHALVEIHSEAELETAVAAGAWVVGINNRNLADFTVDLAITERLAPRVPRDKVVVAESGVSTRADVGRAAHAGAHAVLVGEALMRAGDVAAKVQELASVPRQTGEGR